MDIMPELPTPRGFGRGWGNFTTVCPACGAEWLVTAPMGIKEIPCPVCGFWYHEPQFESHPSELPNDGAWITGRLDGDF